MYIIGGNILSTQLTILEQNKNLLAQMLQTLDTEKREEFKDNFLKLASNDYLVGAVQPKELL